MQRGAALPLMVKNPEIMLEVVVAKWGPGPVETRRVSIGADGLFRSDRSELTNLLPEGRAQLERLAQDNRSGNARMVCIMVTGHADRLGAAEYNQQLSKKRADTLRALLVNNGLDGAVIRAEGRGEDETVVACEGTRQTPELCSPTAG